MTQTEGIHLRRPRAPVPSAVMIVDDDELFREAATLLLEDRGYHVNACGDALEALTCLERGATPDLILLDLVMPRMNGWEFRVQQQREPKWAHIPVIALSADSSAKAAAIHASAFLPKPVEDRQLVDTVQKLLDRREDSQQRAPERPPWPAACEAMMTGITQELCNPLSFLVGNLELAQGAASELEGRLRGPEAFSMVGLRQLLMRTQRGAENLASILRDVSTRSSATARKAARWAAGGLLSGRPRVMIIDDESLVCDALAALLLSDYDVATFTDPHAALASMLEGRFDVILCDLMMRELSGMDLYERVLAQRPELAERMIFLSSGIFTERARNFLATTRRPQLHKPLAREELVDVIEAHLAPFH